MPEFIKIKKKIYHGTDIYFKDIDLTKGKHYKDFGNGFYLAYQKEQSKKMAQKLMRAHKNNTGYIYTYNTVQSEPDRLNELGKVKYFKEADRDRLDFVLKSRRSFRLWHNYDVVIGPTADDDTKLVLNAYNEGLYGDPDSKKAKDILLEQLEVNNLGVQVFIATPAGASILDISSREEEKL